MFLLVKITLLDIHSDLGFYSASGTSTSIILESSQYGKVSQTKNPTRNSDVQGLLSCIYSIIHASKHQGLLGLTYIMCLFIFMLM